MDVDGELLTERQLHDGLALAAPEEGQGAAQEGSDETEQRPDHCPILDPTRKEMEPELRPAGSLPFTDVEDGPRET
jgi:hypothetical protein